MDQHTSDPALSAPPLGRLLRSLTELFARVEHATYVAVGGLLSITAALALVGAAITLWAGVQDWGGIATIAAIIERLLFVLMLVEILHTVRASMRSGGLSAEPFLVVGLIACIRRVLVSTLESTETTKAATNGAGHDEAAFRSSMLELVVLGLLILVMVVSIYMLRRARPPADSA